MKEPIDWYRDLLCVLSQLEKISLDQKALHSTLRKAYSDRADAADLHREIQNLLKNKSSSTAKIKRSQVVPDVSSESPSAHASLDSTRQQDQTDPHQ